MGEFDGIYKRKAIRKYSPEELPLGIIEEVIDMSKHLDKLYEDIDIEVHVVEEGNKIQKISSGIIGSYGKIKAPHYLVITSEEKEGYLENVGFAVESIVLKLTELGIGTCWIGGFIKKQLLKDIITIKNGHKPVIVVSFGYPKDENDIVQEVISSRKRNSVEKFAFGDMGRTWQYIMEAVKAAPSAINTQPWRFFKEGNIIDSYIVKRGSLLTKSLETMNRVDIGIALRHLYVAAEHYDREVEFKKLHGKDRDGYIYITSIIENEEDKLDHTAENKSKAGMEE